MFGDQVWSLTKIVRVLQANNINNNIKNHLKSLFSKSLGDAMKGSCSLPKIRTKRPDTDRYRDL